MGKFIYEGGPKVELEDRALLHLQLVMSTKLRRGEPFAFTWREDQSVGGGRTTVWIHPGSALVFKFSGSRQPSISRAWTEALAFTANSPSGLYLVPEPPRTRRQDQQPSLFLCERRPWTMCTSKSGAHARKSPPQRNTGRALSNSADPRGLRPRTSASSGQTPKYSSYSTRRSGGR